MNHLLASHRGLSKISFRSSSGFEERSALVCCSSSRTQASHSNWPIRLTFSKPATSSCRVTPKPWQTIRKFAVPISDIDALPMHQLLQQIFSGLAAGAIYASLALALVMIYRATDLVNFAQGDMAMFSTYIAWTLVNAGIPFWAAFLVTLVASFLGGMAIERIVIRPV